MSKPTPEEILHEAIVAFETNPTRDGHERARAYADALRAAGWEIDRFLTVPELPENSEPLTRALRRVSEHFAAGAHEGRCEDATPETDERIAAWHALASHPFFDKAASAEGKLIDNLIAALDEAVKVRAAARTFTQPGYLTGLVLDTETHAAKHAGADFDTRPHLHYDVDARPATKAGVIRRNVTMPARRFWRRLLWHLRGW